MRRWKRKQDIPENLEIGLAVLPVVHRAKAAESTSVSVESMAPAATMQRDASWLAAKGDYQDFINTLTEADPRLLQRDPKAILQQIPFTDQAARVVALEVQSDNSVQRTAEFLTADELRVHLDGRPAASSTTTTTNARQPSTPPPPPASSTPRSSPPSPSPSPQPPRGRIYVLEGLGPGFISVLGSHFGLHPSLFVEHERVVVHNMGRDGESDGLPPLPSRLRARRRRHRQSLLQLRYFEVLNFDVAPNSFRLVCAATGRHIGITRDLRWDADKTDTDYFLDVGIVRRKCAVWSTRPRDGDGTWDCLVVCDPPIKSVRTGVEYRDLINVKTRPYQGGYVDFVPEDEQIRVRAEKRGGPPRTCLLDDLAFYLTTHWDCLQGHQGSGGGAGPEAVALLVKKIVASHYHKQAEHLRATLTAVQRGLTRKQDLARMSMKKIEALWSDMQGWERRMSEYCEDLEGIMLQLGIPFVQGAAPPTSRGRVNTLGLERTPPLTLRPPSPSPSPGALGGAVANFHFHTRSRSYGRHSTADYDSDADSDADAEDDTAWHDSTADYQFLYLRFRDLRHRAESLNATVTGLASITGNRLSFREQQRSIRETKSTKAVTLLGLVFIPLAYTASVFSIEPPYGPGGEQFWQYFAFSVPLIFIVMLGYYVLDFGYDGTGAAWSFETFWHSVVKRWDRLRGRDGYRYSEG